MTIRITTRSEGKYIFTQKDGKWFFLKGFSSGLITRIRGPIEVGLPLKFTAIEQDPYGALQDDEIYIETTAVQNISISGLLPLQ